MIYRKNTIKSTRSQAGDINTIVAAIIIAAIIGALGFVYWNSFLKEKPMEESSSDKSNDTKMEAKKESPKDPYEGWKTHKSIAPSGLSFRYPASWEHESNSEEFVNNQGGRSVSHTLYSQKPQVETVNGGPVTTNQYMCVNIDEYTGNWLYAKDVYLNELKSEDLVIADTPVMLKTYSNPSPGRDNRPMGNIMRLLPSSPGVNGQNYIDTNNGYSISVLSQFNCVQGGEGIKNLDADFDAQPETKEAKLIIKSISF